MILKNTNNNVGILRYSHEMNINITVLSTRLTRK